MQLPPFAAFMPSADEGHALPVDTAEGAMVAAFQVVLGELSVAGPQKSATDPAKAAQVPGEDSDQDTEGLRGASPLPPSARWAWPDGLGAVVGADLSSEKPDPVGWMGESSQLPADRIPLQLQDHMQSGRAPENSSDDSANPGLGIEALAVAMPAALLTADKGQGKAGPELDPWAGPRRSAVQSDILRGAPFAVAVPVAGREHAAEPPVAVIQPPVRAVGAPQLPQGDGVPQQSQGDAEALAARSARAGAVTQAHTDVFPVASEQPLPDEVRLAAFARATTGVPHLPQGDGVPQQSQGNAEALAARSARAGAVTQARTDVFPVASGQPLPDDVRLAAFARATTGAPQPGAPVVSEDHLAAPADTALVDRARGTDRHAAADTTPLAAPPEAPRAPRPDRRDVSETRPGIAPEVASRTDAPHQSGAQLRNGAGEGVLAPQLSASVAYTEPGRVDPNGIAAGSETRPADPSLGLPRPAPAPAVPDAGAAHRMETARQVAVQIAEGVHGARDRYVELRLNPDDLGRVSLSLQHDAGGLSVTLTADRADTLDLMRRHIDVLGQELRRLGFGAVEFSFQGGGDGSAGARTAAATRPEPPTADPDANAAEPAQPAAEDRSPRRGAGHGGMDIRL